MLRGRDRSRRSQPREAPGRTAPLPQFLGNGGRSVSEGSVGISPLGGGPPTGAGVVIGIGIDVGGDTGAGTGTGTGAGTAAGAPAFSRAGSAVAGGSDVWIFGS